MKVEVVIFPRFERSYQLLNRFLGNGYPRLETAVFVCSVRTWVGVLTPLTIPPTTQPKIVAFHDLGSRRVEKAMIELIHPATTVVFLPSCNASAECS
jgi:hypothetical protein